MPASGKGWFKSLRIAILLWVLLFVSLSTWLEQYRSTRWRVPLTVAIYPIAADDSPVTRRYVDALDAARFQEIDRFFTREAARYRLAAPEPVRTRLEARLDAAPPERPQNAGILTTAVWSLKLRYWAWRVTRHAGAPIDIRVFVLYHDPALTPTVPHSLGLRKGLIGVVYAFAAASMDGANDVIIAHEMLHTVGATDKYDLRNDAPSFPNGFGNPLQVPLYPQTTTELMAGRRMLSPTRWEQADSLTDVVIGPATAFEIRWLRKAP